VVSRFRSFQTLLSSKAPCMRISHRGCGISKIRSMISGGRRSPSTRPRCSRLFPLAMRGCRDRSAFHRCCGFANSLPLIRPSGIRPRNSSRYPVSTAGPWRAAFGTSPSRFRTMRQLDGARRMLTSGRPLAETALEVGFADQSHMSRMFKRTYGLTAARWTAALA
jgi:hypothetical protein